MPSRLIHLLLGFSLLLNLFVLAGFVYRSWIAPPAVMEGRFPPPPPPGGRGAPGPLEALVHELGLDATQRRALAEVFDRYNNDRRERQREMSRLREQIAAELHSVEPNLAKLETKIDRVSQLRGGQQKENLRATMEILPLLTQDQRERFQTLMTERLSSLSPPRPPGPPRGPGGGPGGAPGGGPGRPPQ